MLNAAQWASAARILVMVVGAIAVGRGWATWEQVQAVASNTDVIAIVGGGIAIAISSFYAIKSRTTKAMVRATAKLPGVTEIQAAPAIANAIPADNVVVTPAGGQG